MPFLLPPEKLIVLVKKYDEKSSPREYFKLQDKTFQRGPVKNSTTVFDLLRDRISLESIQKSYTMRIKIFTSSHCAGIFVLLPFHETFIQ